MLIGVSNRASNRDSLFKRSIRSQIRAALTNNLINSNVLLIVFNLLKKLFPTKVFDKGILNKSFYLFIFLPICPRSSTGEDNESEEEKEAPIVKESSDDIQMNVDDQEYEEFLKSECSNASNRRADALGNNKSNPFKNGKLIDSSDGGANKLSKTEQQNLINELAFPRAGSENLDNCEQAPVQDEKGWQNLWNQTQLEIQELEMRANAIKAMMEKSKDKSTDQTDPKSGGQLLDNIESEDDFVSDGEYKNESELSRDGEPRRSRSKSHKSDLDKKEKRSKSNERERSKSKENRSEKTEKEAKKSGRSRSRSKNRSVRSKSEKADRQERRDRRFESKERCPKSKERRSRSKERSSKIKRSANEPLDEEKQIRKAVEDEFLDIKVDQRKAEKKSKKASTKPDVSRLSMESGEIVDDESDDDEEVSRVIEAKKKSRKARSPSVTSSIDSFGRNRRRKRRSYGSARRRSPESGSLSSLDEILREAELEEQHSGDRVRSQTGQEPAASSKSHSHRHHHLHHKGHHPKSKKQRPSYVDLDDPDAKQERVSEEGEMV